LRTGWSVRWLGEGMVHDVEIHNGLIGDGRVIIRSYMVRASSGVGWIPSWQMGYMEVTRGFVG
jgi:hypothetical protein